MRPSPQGWEIYSEHRSRNPQGEAHNPQWRSHVIYSTVRCVIHSTAGA